MDCDEIQDALLRCNDVDAMEAVIRRHAGFRSAKSVSRDHVRPIEALLHEGNVIKATALALSLAYVHQDDFVSTARKLGVFRASRYRFATRAVAGIVQRLRDLAEPLEFSSDSKVYLDSLLALYTVSDEAACVYEGIVAAMRQRRGRMLATLMLDANRAYEEDRLRMRSAGSRGIKARTSEYHCGVISTLMTIYRMEFGSGLEEWSGLDSDECGQSDGPYQALMGGGHTIHRLIEAEMSVDGIAFVAEPISDGVLVKGPVETLSASIDLGYARMEEDIISDFEAFEPIAARLGLASLFVFAFIFSKSLSRSVAVSSFPFSYPCTVLVPPDDWALLMNLRKDDLLIEDVFTQFQMRAYRCEPLSLDPFEVVDGLMSIDLLKVARLLGVLRDACFQREEVRHASAGDAVAALNLCCMRKAELANVISSVVGSAKAEKIVRLLVMPASEERFDLQYRPFIAVDGWILFPLSIASGSIHARNMELTAGSHNVRVRNGDPAIGGVVGSFRSAGVLAVKEAEFSIDGAVRDTDVLALFGDTLYVMEFKNSFVPSNPHEVRNTYDHLLKAADQLDLRKRWFESLENQKQVWAKLGWSDAFPLRVQTAIVLSHALFHGAVIEGHPVRYARDLMNFIASGDVSVGMTNFQAWEGRSLQPADLCRYFQPDGPCAVQMACMIQVSEIVPIGSSKIEFERWRFDEAIASQGVGA